jgi:hypothetical protein
MLLLSVCFFRISPREKEKEKQLETINEKSFPADVDHQKTKRKLYTPFFGDEGGVSIEEDAAGLAVTLALPVLFDLLSNFLRSLADCLCSRSLV